MSVPTTHTEITTVHYLAAELVERATHGDTVHATVHLEDREQCLEDATEALTGEKTGGKREGPEVE